MLALAFISLAVGILVYSTLHEFIVSQIRSGILDYAVLSSPNAGSWPGFIDSRDPTGPFVLSTFYVYNVTNPDEILAGGKPKLQTIGPLVYHYINTKHNISWENYGDDLLYKEYQRNFPYDDATRNLEQVEITTVDIVLLAALNNPALRDLIPLVKGDSGALFKRLTPAQLLWGYVDHTLLDNKFPGIQPNDTSLIEALTQHGHTRISTGAHRPQTTMEYLEWSSGNQLVCCSGFIAGEAGTDVEKKCAPAWGTYEANSVKGIFGSAAHPDVHPDETLNLATYPFGILRHWPLQCEAVSSPAGPGWTLNDGSPLTENIGACDSYVVNGVSMLKFSLPSWAMGNSSVSSSEAQGYGINGPSGVLGVGQCEQYAPIYFSRPNFLYASTSLPESVEGLVEGDPSKHGSWLGVEPLTGQVLDFHFRLGFNVLVQPITVDSLGLPFSYFPDVVPTFIPVGWGQQESTLSDTQAGLFKSQVYTPVHAAVGCRWAGKALMILGGLLLFYRVTLALFRFTQKGFFSSPGLDESKSGEAEESLLESAYDGVTIN